MDRDIYLIRRGNVRMSSHRNSVYYLNQAKARAVLLKASAFRSSPLFQAELVKQILIYYFHSVKNRLVLSKQS